ncbi:MAG: response regulator transcription factor [Sphingobacteriia bacterium]|nr:response regulator transcription factor [Sphingobacteriia bacterium]
MTNQITNLLPVSILIAEDDLNLGILLSDYLTMQGYQSKLCRDGKEALEIFGKTNFNLCVLDVMMPKMDGFTLAKEIREIRQDIPIIFLTAKSLQEDVMKGFKLGCDDYITKPFNTEELNLRIKAVLKRCSNAGAPGFLGSQTVILGNTTFDMGNLMISYNDKKTYLTRKEAELLKLLWENKNNLVEREKATGKIWKQSTYFSGRSMDVFVARLRKYLSPDPSVSIVNVHGTGFKLIIDEGQE